MAAQQDLTDAELKLRADVDALQATVATLVAPATAGAGTSVDPTQFQELMQWVEALKTRVFTPDEIAGGAQALLTAATAA